MKIPNPQNLWKSFKFNRNGQSEIICSFSGYVKISDTNITKHRKLHCSERKNTSLPTPSIYVLIKPREPFVCDSDVQLLFWKRSRYQKQQQKTSKDSLKPHFMNLWTQARAFAKLKGITKYKNNPQGVQSTVFHLSPATTLTRLNAALRSIFAK